MRHQSCIKRQSSAEIETWASGRAHCDALDDEARERVDVDERVAHAFGAVLAQVSHDLGRVAHNVSVDAQPLRERHGCIARTSSMQRAMSA